MPITSVFGDTDCCIKDAEAEDDEERRLFYDTCGVCGGDNMTGLCNPNRVFWMRMCVAVLGCLISAHLCLCSWFIWELLEQQQWWKGVDVKAAKNNE